MSINTWNIHARRRTILAQECLEPFRFERHGHFARGDFNQRSLQRHADKYNDTQDEHGIGQVSNVVHETWVVRAAAQILQRIGKVKGNGCGMTIDIILQMKPMKDKNGKSKSQKKTNETNSTSKHTHNHDQARPQ